LGKPIGGHIDFHHESYNDFGMIRQVQELLHAAPFAPFKIRTSDGKEYLVRSADHAFLSPSKGQVIVFHEDDVHVTFSGLHIVAVEQQTEVT
jgi:hypothetical protein